MKTAIFLGAGASRTFGYPLTGDILPLVLARLVAGTLFDGSGSPESAKTNREHFRALLDRLVPGWLGAWNQANPAPVSANPKPIGISITDILTLVDHTISVSVGKGAEGPSGLAAFRELLERAICQVLQVQPPADNSPEAQAHTAFITWLLERSDAGGVSVITSNYDLTVDDHWFAKLRSHGLAEPGELIDLGFSWRDVGSGALHPRPAQPVGRLLKLHGSLNWLRCPLCGHTYFNSYGRIAELAFVDELNEFNTCHCNPWTRLRLPLVAPSLARTTGDGNLQSIWGAACEALQAAAAWYIIGYSMPSEDVAIRSLLCRAWGSCTLSPQVEVIQWGDATQGLYAALFPGCTYNAGGLAAWLQRRPGG